jgi:hypothetical protein
VQIFGKILFTDGTVIGEDPVYKRCKYLGRSYSQMVQIMWKILSISGANIRKILFTDGRNIGKILSTSGAYLQRMRCTHSMSTRTVCTSLKYFALGPCTRVERTLGGRSH